VPVLMSSYRSNECLVRMNYRLKGEGNVVITGLFPAYAISPLNRKIDWRMTKFNREFMV
ncbi:vomeronasal type-2 receptor 116-like, partial [Sigmodon hispidus]